MLHMSCESPESGGTLHSCKHLLNFSQARPRESRLEHKTANRAKAPKRRPPSTMFVRDAVSKKELAFAFKVISTCCLSLN